LKGKGRKNQETKVAVKSASKVMDSMVIKITNCAPANPEMKKPLLIAPFALSVFSRIQPPGLLGRHEKKG
jgi:hypothetical protein